MAAGTQTRRILIKVDTQGNRDIQDLANKLGGINKNTKSLKDNVQALTSAFSGWIAFLGVREIARMSDEMQNLANRLKLVSRAGEDSSVTMQKILALANETNQSVAEVGQVYTRMAASLKGAGATSGSLLEITKALINSFRLAGATGTETTATIIQLSQAFSSGQLRGQELRSVMEQNVELAGLLRQRFGKDIYKQAEAGLITITEVLKVLRTNQERINAQALILAPTFEQVLTKAFNKAQFAIHSLNDEFKLSSKFATAMDAFISRLSLIAVVAGALALTQIPVLITSLRALSVVMFQLATRNPLGVALIALSVVVLSTNDSLGEFIDKIRNLGAWLVQLRIWIIEARVAINESFITGLSKIGVSSKSLVSDLQTDVSTLKELSNLADSLGTPNNRPSPLDPNADKGKSDKEFAELLARLEKMYGATAKAKKTKEILGELNKEFLTGTLAIEEYNKKLVNFEVYKLNREFSEGKFDIQKYNEGLRNIQEKDLDKKFKEGSLSVQQYNDSIANLKIDELNDKFAFGKITLQEYNAELVKTTRAFDPSGALVAGTTSYLESIGTVSQGVADAIRNTFSALEDNLVEMIKTGRFNFASFAQGILDDLSRIIIRASIIKPIAEGILNLGISSAPGNYSGTTTDATGAGFNTTAARGMAFDKGIRRFAKGGVVSSPTMFGYGKGQTGLMGEAGAEAILPLQRGSGGSLGVAATVTPVTVNVINQSGNEVSQTETSGPNGEKTIEILIHGKVKEGFASGKYDKIMKSSYGLSRKGS